MDIELCSAGAGQGLARLIVEFTGTVTTVVDLIEGEQISYAGDYTAIRVEVDAAATGWVMCSILDLDVPDQRLFDVTPAPVKVDGLNGVVRRIVLPSPVSVNTVDDARLDFNIWTMTDAVNAELQAGTRHLTIGKAPTAAARQRWAQRANRKRS